MAEFSGSFGGFFPSLMVQQPDPLGSFVGGLERGYQMQMLPYQMALAGQEYEKKGLDIEQARMALGIDRMVYGAAASELTGRGGSYDTGAGAPSVGRTEGVSNGPQGGVSYNTSQTAAPSTVATPYGGASSGQGYDLSGAMARRDAALGGLSPSLQRLMALREHKYGPDTEKQIFENQKQQMQWNQQPAISNLESIFNSPHPANFLAANAEQLMPHWLAYARTNGIDPIKGATDDNVRQALGFYANQLRSQVGMEPKQYPQPLAEGPAGSQYDPITHERKVAPTFADISPQTYQTRDENPNSPTYGQTVNRIKMVQTKPGVTWGYPGDGGGAGTGLPAGMAATAAGTRPPGGAAPAPRGTAAPARPAGGGTRRPAAGGGDITLGAPPAKPEELEIAGIALRARQPLQEMNAAEAEGPVLDAKDRELVISALTKDPDGLRNMLPGVAKQWIEGLNFTGKKARYLQNLIPVVQMAAQQMPKTSLRGVDAPNLLASMESMIPRSKDDIATAQANRQHAYWGILAATGNAAGQAEYRRTLGVDRQVAMSGGQAITMGNDTYVKKPDGKIVRIIP